jgi:single-strand DNA-binding protein
MNINHVTIVGRVTSDPQLKMTKTGQAVCTVGVATNRTWTDKEGIKQEEVEFHNVVFFGRQAEIAEQYLKKGNLVGIEGRLKTRQFTDRDGVERKATAIIAEQLHLGPATATAQAPAKKAAPAAKVEQDSLIDEDDEDTGRDFEHALEE